MSTGVLAWLSGARQRIGFARDLRGWFLTDRVVPQPKSVPHPAMDEYLRLADRMGCKLSARQLTLGVLPEDQANLETFWSGRWLTTNNASNNDVPFDGVALQSDVPRMRNSHRSERPAGLITPPSYVCLNTGGAFGAAKNWPREYFAELARRIALELHKSVLVVCGPAEREDASWIETAARHPSVVSLANAPLSIGLTKAAIRGADLLVTTDSGPRHFAAAFDTPVITLFGPTHIAWSETRYERAEHLQLKLDCGPCQQRECPLKHHRCLRELSVETVFAAVQRQLARTIDLATTAGTQQTKFAPSLG